MKRKITNEEKEEFAVTAFDYEYRIKQKIKKLISKLEKLESEKEIKFQEYKKIKEEYNEILLAYTGRGKYYSILVAPATIQNKLVSLENDIYNCYKEEVDDKKKKEYELKKGPLTEDLDEATKKVSEFEKYREEVEDKFIETKKDLDSCRNNYKKTLSELKIAKKDQKTLINSIRKVDNAYLSNRKVDERKLQLKPIKE